eukprot:Pgem_evm3s8721
MNVYEIIPYKSSRYAYYDIDGNDENLEEQKEFMEKFYKDDVYEVDKNVYSSNRNMRLVGSSKKGENRPLIPPNWHPPSRTLYLFYDDVPPRKEFLVREFMIAGEGCVADIQKREVIKDQDISPSVSTGSGGATYDQMVIILEKVCEKIPNYPVNYDTWHEMVWIIKNTWRMCKDEDEDDWFHLANSTMWNDADNDGTKKNMIIGE